MLSKTQESLQDKPATFRQHIPDLETPRFTTASQQDPYEYSAFFNENHAPPWLYSLTQTWQQLYEEPFKGVTTDGIIPSTSIYTFFFLHDFPHTHMHIPTYTHSHIRTHILY
jgi:hypothetical protein